MIWPLASIEVIRRVITRKQIIMTRLNVDALRLTCRFDAERADYLRALSDRMGLSTAEVVRLALDSLTGRVPPALFEELKELPPETRQELARLTQEVNRIGVNVNQLVRVTNAVAADALFDERDPDLNEVKGALRCVTTELRALRSRIEVACR